MRHGGKRLVLGGPKPRALLAALLLDRGRVVPTDRLVEAIWDGHPAETARALIQTYVSALRRELGEIIETRPPGYRIALDAGELDTQRFEQLAAQGRAAAH